MPIFYKGLSVMYHFPDLRFLILEESMSGASSDRDIRLVLGPAGGFDCLFFSPENFLETFTFSPENFLATLMFQNSFESRSFWKV